MSTLPVNTEEEDRPDPVSMKPSPIGLRETTLFAIGAGYAALMFNMPEAAVLCGWVAVGLVLFAAIRGPRPSGLLTFVYGLGLFVMVMWWPREHWWEFAIPLLWVGIVLMLVGGVIALQGRRAARGGPGHEA